MVNSTFPRTINHIGLNVTKLEEAAEWYQRIFGWRTLVPPFEITAGEGEPGERFAMLAGQSFKKTRLCYMTTGNGVGIELFEFEQPATPPATQPDNSPLGEYWRFGLWHFCVTDPDVDGLIDTIVANGGSRASQTVETPPDSGYRLGYAQDPFGNVIEIMSVNFENGLSNLV